MQEKGANTFRVALAPDAAAQAETTGTVASSRGSWLAWIFASMIAFGLVVFLAGTKIRTLHSANQFDPRDDAGLFWTESAFHYRYAKMVAEGRALPETDLAMQYPEGIGVFRDEMPVMEVVGGRLYRLGHSSKPFHVFLLEFVCIYSSLILIPAFILSAGAFGRPEAGLVSTLFYMLTFPAIGPVVLFAYVRQDFALPMLFLATALWLLGIDRNDWKRLVVAGALMAGAFASWHLSQFYYTVLLAGCVTAYFLRREWRDRIAYGLAIMTAFLLVAGVLVPALRNGWLPVSVAMLASYALLATHYALARRGRPTLVCSLAFLVFFAAGVLIAHSIGAAHVERYSHVYRLMWDKIRFLGIKPADPARMSFESRVMWTSSFLSPTWWSFRRWLGGAWIIGFWGFACMVRDMQREGPRFLSATLIWMGAVFIVLFGLIQRMDVFATFFVCVWAGRTAAHGWPTNTRRWARYAAMAVLLAYSWKNITTMYMVSTAPPPLQLRPLLQAIRQHTQTNDVILAHFPLSPVICAHTERPVVIHSKFENRRVREKVREFYEAFYESEEGLHRVCRKFGVRYFVYEPEIALSTTRESIRYMAARMDLTDDAVAVRMQFLPESLRWFQLVFQTDRYRVYRVLEVPREAGPVPFPKVPIYDSRQFRREDIRVFER